MVRFLTANESHKRALMVILEGIPTSLSLDHDAITRNLHRQQNGYGHGRRIAIESDRTNVLSSVRAGETIEKPIAIMIENRDWPNWQYTMRVGTNKADKDENNDPPIVEDSDARRSPVTLPRPRHADLAGVAKYGHTDIQNVLKRASARETTTRVTAGAIAKQLLAQTGASITSHVFVLSDASLPTGTSMTFDQAATLPDDSPVRCVDADVERRMIAAIDRAREAGDTIDNTFEVIVKDLPVRLDSYTQ